MIKRTTKILIITVLFFIVTVSAFADERKPISKKRKGNFSNNSFSKSSTTFKKGGTKGPAGIPDPDGGDGGGPMGPIPSGLAFLLVSSTLYFGKKLRDENR